MTEFKFFGIIHTKIFKCHTNKVAKILLSNIGNSVSRETT